MMIDKPRPPNREAERLFFICRKYRNEVKGIGRIFDADIFDCPSSCSWLYCLAVKTAEERQKCKQQRNYAHAPCKVN